MGNNKSYPRHTIEKFWVDAIKNDDIIALEYDNIYFNYGLLFDYIFRYNAIKIYKKILIHQHDYDTDCEYEYDDRYIRFLLRQKEIILKEYFYNIENKGYIYTTEMAKTIYDYKHNKYIL